MTNDKREAAQISVQILGVIRYELNKIPRAKERRKMKNEVIHTSFLIF